jgi:hypothetical protein
MPRGGRRQNAGRPSGAKNKSTVERDLMIRYQAEREAAGTEKKLAKDALEDYLNYFIKVAKLYQPINFGEGAKPEENGVSNPKKFKEFSKAAIECAIALAPYQSPRLAAVRVEAPPATQSVRRITVDVFEHTGEHVGRFIDGEAQDITPPIGLFR